MIGAVALPFFDRPLFRRILILTTATALAACSASPEAAEVPEDGPVDSKTRTFEEEFPGHQLPLERAEDLLELIDLEFSGCPEGNRAISVEEDPEWEPACAV